MVIKLTDIRIGDRIGYWEDAGEWEVVEIVHPIDGDGIGQLNFHNGNTLVVSLDTELWWFGFEPDLTNPWRPGMGDHAKWQAEYELAKRERVV